MPPVDLGAGGAAGRHPHGGVSGTVGQLLQHATTPSRPRTAATRGEHDHFPGGSRWPGRSAAKSRSSAKRRACARARAPLRRHQRLANLAHCVVGRSHCGHSGQLEICPLARCRRPPDGGCGRRRTWRSGLCPGAAARLVRQPEAARPHAARPQRTRQRCDPTDVRHPGITAGELRHTTRLAPMLTSASSAMETVNADAPDAGHRARASGAGSAQPAPELGVPSGGTHDSVHVLPPSYVGEASETRQELPPTTESLRVAVSP